MRGITLRPFALSAGSGAVSSSGPNLMHLIAPDIMAEGSRPLSGDPRRRRDGRASCCGSIGSYGHRFWIVMVLTLAAGVYGLYFGPAYGMQPMVAGFLLAVSTGTLGLPSCACWRLPREDWRHCGCPMSSRRRWTNRWCSSCWAAWRGAAHQIVDHSAFQSGRNAANGLFQSVLARTVA